MRINREPFQIGELSDGWWAVKVPGVAHVVDLRLEEVGGQPEVVGLRIRPASLADFFAEPPQYDPDTGGPSEFRVAELWAWEQDQRDKFIGEHDRPAVTVEMLRSLPLGQMKQEVLTKRNDPWSVGTSVSRVDAGGGLSEGFLRSVAERYEKAAASGLSPRAVISREEGVSKAAVSKWIGRARGLGLLGYPERPGRTGYTEDSSPWKETRRSESGLRVGQSRPGKRKES